MSEVENKNIRRYTYREHPARDENNRFCLLGVLGFETDDDELRAKRDSLLESLGAEWRYDRQTQQALECTIGGCDVVVREDTASGKRERIGECRAASYCLKEAFEAVGETSTVEAGKELYRAIMDTCEGRSSSMAAGNYCPRVDCGLSAGVSIDQVPGTVGECAVEIRSSQQQLPGVS